MEGLEFLMVNEGVGGGKSVGPVIGAWEPRGSYGSASLFQCTLATMTSAVSLGSWCVSRYRSLSRPVVSRVIAVSLRLQNSVALGQNRRLAVRPRGACSALRTFVPSWLLSLSSLIISVNIISTVRVPRRLVDGYPRRLSSAILGRPHDQFFLGAVSFLYLVWQDNLRYPKV